MIVERERGKRVFYYRAPLKKTFQNGKWVNGKWVFVRNDVQANSVTKCWKNLDFQFELQAFIANKYASAADVEQCKKRNRMRGGIGVS